MTTEPTNPTIETWTKEELERAESILKNLEPSDPEF